MTIRISLLGILVTSAAVAPAWSAGMACSIHPPAGASPAALAALATVSQPEAARIAIAKVRHPHVSVASAELETERHCLLWSFDLHPAGSPTLFEVQVDAGNGRVLSVKRETAADEAREAKADAVHR